MFDLGCDAGIVGSSLAGYYVRSIVFVLIHQPLRLIWFQQAVPSSKRSSILVLRHLFQGLLTAVLVEAK